MKKTLIRQYSKPALSAYVENRKEDVHSEDYIGRCMIRMQTGIEAEREKRQILEQLYLGELPMSLFFEWVKKYMWKPSDTLFELFTCALEEEQTAIAILLLKEAYAYGRTNVKIVTAFAELLRAFGQESDALFVEENYQNYLEGRGI